MKAFLNSTIVRRLAMKSAMRTLLFRVLTAALMPLGSLGAQDTAGQVLARLEKLSPENRQKTLIERARNEKEVMFYSSLQSADAEPYVRAFNKRYPFIKINV